MLILVLVKTTIIQSIQLGFVAIYRAILFVIFFLVVPVAFSRLKLPAFVPRLATRFVVNVCGCCPCLLLSFFPVCGNNSPLQ